MQIFEKLMGMKCENINFSELGNGRGTLLGVVYEFSFRLS